MRTISALAIIPVISGTLSAQTFERIVGTVDLVPGTQGAFADFQNLHIRDGHVAFAAWNAGNPGIYIAGPGGVRVVVDALRPIPGMWVSPDEVMALDDDGTLVFPSWAQPGTAQLMRYQDGALTTIMHTSDPMPGTAGHFWSFGLPVIENGRVLFAGNNPGGLRSGLYEVLAPGQAAVVVDTSMNVPGTPSTFSLFNLRSGPSLIDGRFAFTAMFAGTQEGVFVDHAGSISKIIQTGNAIPGGGGFTSLLNPVPMNAGVAYIGTSATGAGIYLTSNGQTSVIATRDRFPGLWTLDFAADADGLLFQTGGATNEIFYWTQATGITRLIGAGDLIDGRVVLAVAHSPGSLSGDAAAIIVRLDNHESAIYRVTIPAPSSMSILILITFAARRSRRV